ncbi:uncharacterized protein LOC135160489 isoform X2 [Diachasmimorpha longicaudata]|uniref:uncharacterized protein LOC135160489 isoform X2 n=1 Tax=Diachasmimorpha longicaudata TaxID=58733 RepID=UPI0030B89499
MSVRDTLLLIFFMTILTNDVQSRPDLDWFDSVAVRLFHSGHTHTAIIINQRSSDNADTVKNELFPKIMETVPSVVVEMDNGVIKWKPLEFGVINKYTTALLFIVYADYSGDNGQIYEVMREVNQLPDLSINYLLVILRTSGNVVKKIHKNKEVSADDTKFGCKKLACYGVNSKIIDDSSVQVIMHQFNFFAKIFYHQVFQSGIEIFPNFGKNRHGHPLVVWPPRNFYRPVVKNMAPVLNFTILEVYDKMKADMLYGAEIMFDDNPILPNFTVPDLMRSIELVMLIPNTYKLNTTLINKSIAIMSLLFAIIGTISLLAVLLKLDQKIWNTSNLFAMMFSITVSSKPSRTNQRILFLLIVILGFLYSSDVYSSLTNIGTDPLLIARTYNTFEDIDETGLYLKMTNFDFHIFIGAEDAKLNLKHKVFIYNELFADEMNNPTNFCYLLTKKKAFHFKNKCASMNRQELWTVGKPIFGYYKRNIYFHHGLPGQQQLRNTMTRFRESGLLNRWFSDTDNGTMYRNDKNDIANGINKKSETKFLKFLIILNVFGISLASIVFIGELLVYHVKKLIEKLHIVSTQRAKKKTIHRK